MQKNKSMILDKYIYPIGKLVKVHGLNGEMLYDAPQGMPETDFPYVVLKPDGIAVPFFIENIRSKSDVSGFIKLEDIDTEENAREYIGHTIYLDREVVDFADSDEIQINYFIGFQMIDKRLGYIGEIIDIDESTANILFVAQKENQQILVPATDDFILNIDHETKEIHLDLPDGLLEI